MAENEYTTRTKKAVRAWAGMGADEPVPLDAKLKTLRDAWDELRQHLNQEFTNTFLPISEEYWGVLESWITTVEQLRNRARSHAVFTDTQLTYRAIRTWAGYDDNDPLYPTDKLERIRPSQFQSLRRQLNGTFAGRPCFPISLAQWSALGATLTTVGKVRAEMTRRRETKKCAP